MVQAQPTRPAAAGDVGGDVDEEACPSSAEPAGLRRFLPAVPPTTDIISAPLPQRVVQLPPPTAARGASPWRLLLGACVLVATLSLLLPSVPTYDPWAWLIWGREIIHGDLVTTVGPSWKPLPVLFTTPFALLGDTGAPLAWLVVARAGGLLAVAMAYRLGARLAGPLAGIIAAAALILCDGFAFDVARGNSEGILVGLCLWAIERHLDGRRGDAFVLGVAAALLRPEVWPFVALYGVYLWRRDDTRRTRVVVASGGVLVAALWFVPEYIGSGELLRAATRARQPIAASAANAAHPFLAVFDRSSSLLTPPVYVGAIAAVLLALRVRDRLVLALAAGSTVIMLTVAAMTQAGFAGNLRYVELPAAIVCVLAGVGWVRLCGAAWSSRGALAMAAVLAVGVLFAIPYVRDDLRALRVAALSVADQADVYGAAPEAIAAAGGEAKLKACGPIIAGAFQTQTVAWYLHLHQTEVQIFASTPGTKVTTDFSSLASDPRFPTSSRTGHWVIGASCGTRMPSPQW